MAQKKIIDSLINEDESLSLEEDIGAAEDITSWNIKKEKKGKTVTKAMKKICSPVLRQSPSVSKLKILEKLCLPKLRPIQSSIETSNLKKSQNSNEMKSNPKEKLLTITELKSAEHLLFKVHEVPHRARFRYSNVLKLKLHKPSPRPINPNHFPFYLDLPNPRTLSQTLENKPSKKKRLNLNRSLATDPFFTHSKSITIVKAKSSSPESIRMNYYPPISDVKILNKPVFRSKSLNTEKYKIKKNILLVPIFENICKYNLALK